MHNTLEQLLASIDPVKTYDPTFARANTAINTFEKKSACITSRDEFVECLTQFFCHVEAAVLDISRSVYSDSEFHWGRCRDMLCHLYGPNGEKTAFEMARTGHEGGLYAILKGLSLRMAEEYTDNEISARVTEFINSLNPDAMLAVMDEYIDRYGHLLPLEMTEGGAARIKANFNKILDHHPKLLRTLRNVGR